MGCNFLFSNSSYSNDNNILQNVNPNPKKYKIKDLIKIDNYLLLSINYFDCNNYEGNKILLFKDCKLIDLFKQGSIDPHFSDNNKYYSPIVRFVPTEEGWDMGIKLINKLLNKE